MEEKSLGRSRSSAVIAVNGEQVIAVGSSMRDGYYVSRNSTELSLTAGLIGFEEGYGCERADRSSNSIGLDLALRRI